MAESPSFAEPEKTGECYIPLSTDQARERLARFRELWAKFSKELRGDDA